MATKQLALGLIERDIDCPKFEGCGAPLCRLDASSVKNGVWYPREEICRRRSVPDWVRKQRAIARTYASAEKYFTVTMLQAIRRVARGIGGADPDKELADKKWLNRREKPL